MNWYGTIGRKDMKLNRILGIFLLMLWAGAGSVSVAQPSSSDRARAYYFAAEEAYADKKYDSALSALDKARDLLGGSNARLSALRVKILFDLERYEDAKAALDVFYGFKPADGLARTMASYLLQIDEKIAEEEARVERERLAAIAREKERQAALERQRIEEERQAAQRRPIIAEIEAIQDQCATGLECFRIGQEFVARFVESREQRDWVNQKKYMSMVRILHHKACTLGYKEGCSDLTYYVSDHTGKLDQNDIIEYETLFSKQCNNVSRYTSCYHAEVHSRARSLCFEGHGQSCLFSALFKAEDGAYFSRIDSRIGSLEKACNMGVPQACRWALIFHRELVSRPGYDRVLGNVLSNDEIREVNFAIGGCNGGQHDMCKIAADTLWSGTKYVEKNRDLSRELYGRYCQADDADKKLCKKRGSRKKKK